MNMSKYKASRRKEIRTDIHVWEKKIVDIININWIFSKG